MAKDPGYVYILTNPSFREDWVKIGKSSRPVDIRSKELDNTAVPLPFEIYATLKTKKYSEVEKLVHKTIDRLTDLRIRQNREFFNVRPDVALDILKDIAFTLDDAEVNTYNHGNAIHQVKEDEDRKAGNTSGVRKYKDAFWKGYIEAMRNNPVFNSYFSLRNSIPRYSYDLAIGTSSSNIFQAAIRKKLTVGIYFHGKDLFMSISEYHKEIDKMLGEEADWTEYEKDCAIFISREFDLENKDGYQEAYEWLLARSVKFKEAYDWSIQKLNSSNRLNSVSVTDEENTGDAVQPNPGRRSRFCFSMVGIGIGEELTFVPTGIKVRVVSDNQIEYQGRIYKLSPFVGTFIPDDKRNSADAYQGAKYFSYKGEILNDIRMRMEADEH